jgi:uncharacterized protein YecT (DUF1311 family)
VTEYNLSHLYRTLKDPARADKLAASARKAWLKFVAPRTKFASDEDLYEAVLKMTQQDYETPHWETRAEQLVTGKGRL